MIQNQCLTIPPDHPSAIELDDLLRLEKAVIDRLLIEDSLVNAGGDPALRDQIEAAMWHLGKEIDALLQRYRTEQGADDTYSVGLTYQGRLPVVQRPGGPILSLV